MEETLTIALGQLITGGQINFDEQLAPTIFDVDEAELAFEQAVHLTGEAYVVDGNLVVSFSSDATAKMVCAVCNEWCDVPLRSKGCHTVELADIKGDNWDIAQFVAQELLLEVPTYAECQGSCPHRDDIEKYLRKSDENSLAVALEGLELE